MTTVPMDPNPSPVLDPSVSYDPGADGPGDAQNTSTAASDGVTEYQTDAPAGTDSGSGSDDTIGSKDVLSDIKAAQGPLQPTATDAQGVERIVGPAVDSNWSPAPSEPDADEMAHLEAVAAAEKKRREERLGATQAAPDNIKEGAEVTKAAFAAERGE